MNIRLAKFKDLIPSSLPFVEGKLDGHKERKNYSILGPGVAEDAEQSIKISEPHGFNLGAVSAKPFNGSGLHSHLTAEVFIIYSGKWRFYWGSEGKDETILNPGDIISMPTNMFRAFENAGDEEGLIFVVLGGDDPGIVTWIPEVLERAKKTGMALLDDNSLIDLNIKAIPNGRRLLEPISNDEIKKFNNYKLDQLQSNISSLSNRIQNEIDIGDNITIMSSGGIETIVGNIPKQKTFTVLSIYEDINNKIWIGTDGYGLLSYSPNEDKITWHGEGKEIRNMSINSITQTYDGSFWLGTDNGLIRYNSDTDKYRVFDRSDGLLNNNINRNSFYNEQNILYFGTIGGINFFNPIVFLD